MNKKVKKIVIVSTLIVLISVSFGLYWFNRKFEVVFINSDNSIIERRNVKYGHSVEDIEVPIVPEGYKFVSWDKPLNKITKNTIIKATVEEINNGKNVISLGNSYGKQDSTISIPLIIDGDVEISALDMNIEYDADYLTFVESANEDSGALVNEKDGKIYVSFVSGNNVKSTIYMCDLTFKINKEIEESTLLQINVNKCGKFDEENIVETNCSTIDGLVSYIS